MRECQVFFKYAILKKYRIVGAPSHYNVPTIPNELKFAKTPREKEYLSIIKTLLETARQDPMTGLSHKEHFTTVNKGNGVFIAIDGDGLKKYNEGGILIDRLEYFFKTGKSDKRGRVGQIGKKGFGSKIAFHSDEVFVESKFRTEFGEISSVNGRLEHPYRSICERTQLIVNAEEEANVELPGETGTRISVKRFIPAIDARFYDPRIMKEYIQWYTTGGTILPLLPPTIDGAPVRTFRINTERLAGSTISFNDIHYPPAYCNPATLFNPCFAGADKINFYAV